METILAPLANMGFGAVMAGAIAWFLWHVLRNTIPQMHAQHRAEMEVQRSSYLSMIERQATLFAESLHSVEQRFQDASEAMFAQFTEERRLCQDRFEHLFEEVRSIGHIAKAVRDRGCAAGGSQT